MIKVLLIFFISFYVLDSLKPNSTDCEKIRDGLFYYYGKDKNTKILINRMGSIQNEIDFKTGDTSVWKVAWTDSCTMNLKFIRSSKKLSQEELSLYNLHYLNVQIIAATDNYYVFKLGIDTFKLRNSPVDTAWRQ